MADEITPQQPNLVEQYAQSVNQRKLEAEAQMQKLIDSLNVRKNMPFDPVLMGLARGLLSPTKTGSFGESLGYGLGAASEEAQKRAAQDVELAKMEFELRQKQEAQRAAQEEQKFAMQYFNRNRAPAAPAAPQALAKPELTAMPPTEALPLSSKPQMSTPEAPALLPEDMPVPMAAPREAPAAPASTQQLGDEDDEMLAILAPNIYKLKQQFAEERRKKEELILKRRQTEAQERVTIESGGVKVSVPKIDADRMSNAIEKRDYKTAQRLYEKYALPFPFVKEGENYRLKTPAEAAEEIETAKAIETKPYFIPEVGGTIAMLPRDFKAYRAAVAEGKGEEWVDKNLRRKPVGGEPTKAEAKPFLTEEERKQQEAKETKVMEQDVKQSAEGSALAQQRATSAMELKEALDDIDARAKSNPNVFGLLQKPGVAAAIARAYDEGSSTVKLGKLAEYKLSRQDLLALQDAANAEARLRNIIRKAARIPGEGTFSDLETRMQAALALTTSMSPEIVRIRAEVMRERAVFDEKVFDLWSKYKKSQKGYFQEFLTESKEYKDLKKNYENKLKIIRDANSVFFANPRGTAAPSAAPRSAAPAAQPREGGSALDKWNR